MKRHWIESKLVRTYLKNKYLPTKELVNYLLNETPLKFPSFDRKLIETKGIDNISLSDLGIIYAYFDGYEQCVFNYEVV